MIEPRVMPSYGIVSTMFLPGSFEAVTYSFGRHGQVFGPQKNTVAQRVVALATGIVLVALHKSLKAILIAERDVLLSQHLIAEREAEFLHSSGADYGLGPEAHL